MRLQPARVVEGVKPFKIVDIHDLPRVIFPSGQPCLEGKMTFGNPFEDSTRACFRVKRKPCDRL